MLRHLGLTTLLIAAMTAPGFAYEEIRISEVYSDACGSKQFIELAVPRGNGDVNGRQITIFDRNGNATRTLTFTSDVVDDSRVLVATANLSDAAGVASDSAIPVLNSGDIDPEGGAIWFGCCGGTQDVDVILYGNYAGPVPPTGTGGVTGGFFEPLPGDGRSMVRLFPQPEFGDAVPTPTNNSGQQGMLPDAGDIDADNDVDLVDVDLLVGVLLGSDSDSAHVARADIDCDKAANGLDIQLMVNLLFPDSDVLPPCPGIFEPYVSITYDPLNTFVPFTGPQPSTFFTWGLTALDIPNVVLASAQGQIWATINDGCSWSSIGTTDPGGLYKIEAGPIGYAYAWVENSSGIGPTAGIYQIHNNPPGSANFDVQFRPAPVDPMLGFGVDRFNPHHIRTARADGQLQESFDGGQSWVRIGVPAVATTSLAYVFEFDPNDLDHVVFGRATDGAFVTFDGGDTWTQSNGLKTLPHRGNNFFSATISPLDGNIVFGRGIDLGENGLPGDPPPPPSNGNHIYASTDGGLNFFPVLSQGTGGGEPGEGVFMQNQPVMKSDWNIPTKFHYLFSTSCVFGGTYFYSYDLNTGIIETAIADETNGCIPKARQFEWSRTTPGALLMGFEFVSN